MAAAWYLNCFVGFVPTSKQALHTRIFETILTELIEWEEEEDEPKEAKEAVDEKDT